MGGLWLCRRSQLVDDFVVLSLLEISGFRLQIHGRNLISEYLHADHATSYHVWLKGFYAKVPQYRRTYAPRLMFSSPMVFCKVLRIFVLFQEDSIAIKTCICTWSDQRCLTVDDFDSLLGRDGCASLLWTTLLCRWDSPGRDVSYQVTDFL